MKLADGLEKAFIGSTISAFDRKQVALYDYNKCILILAHDHDMTEEEAMEYFDYNVIGSWVGDDTPAAGAVGAVGAAAAGITAGSLNQDPRPAHHRV